MLDYRVYVIGEDGQFAHRYESRCATDDEARDRARQLLDVHDVEVWQLGRKVDAFSRKRKSP